MTRYALMLKASGMSQTEAARFHCVRADTVAKWVSGRMVPPDGVLKDISSLIAEMLKYVFDMEGVLEGQPSAEDCYNVTNAFRPNKETPEGVFCMLEGMISGCYLAL